jgi:hypothetical protein
MGTSNFHNVNAGRIYACEIENDFDYDDLKENIINELELDERGSDPHELRSFPSNVLGTLTKRNVTITVIIRSGYYEGCNLDWSIEYGDNDCDNIDDYCDEVKEDNWLTNIEKYNATRFLAQDEEYLINKVEAVFETFSTPLKVVARFSNGETIYERS